MQTKDDGVVLETSESSESGSRKKSDETCQHHTQQFSGGNTSQTVVGFECECFDDKRKDGDNNHSSKITDALPSENIDLNAQVPDDVQMVSTSQSSSPFSVVSKAKQENFTSKLSDMFQKVEDLESGDLRSCNMSNSSVCDGSQLSPTSVTSVTTDLGLGLCSYDTINESKKTTSTHISSNIDLANRNTSEHPALSSSCLSSDCGGQVDLTNPKILFEALAKKVGWQEEALHVIIRTLACCQTKRGRHHRANERGDVWMNFVGPDRQGKKKIAVYLAEFLFGSRESFIFVDLNSQEMKEYEVKLRGKTTIDHLVGELYKKTLSVVFLENADKADVLSQNRLFQAIKTGKFIDSHGRLVSVKNSVFVTSFPIHHNSSTPRREPSKYSEERILRTKGGDIKLKVEHLVGDMDSQSLAVINNSSVEGISNNKRKLVTGNEFRDEHKISDTAKRVHTALNWLLDLNLPAEQNEMLHVDDVNSEHVSYGKQNPWFQDLYDQVDETVVFKPYNFDALADRLVKVIRGNFHKILGSECVLQMDPEVMEQLLAAAYVSETDTEVEDWVEQVLNVGFAEVQRRYKPRDGLVVKLGTCQEDQASGVYLPQKVLID